MANSTKMDYRKSSLTKILLHHPGHIIIGSQESAFNYVIVSLHEVICACSNGQACKIYTQLETKQHYATRWFMPEKSYNKDDFDSLFTTISFALNNQEHMFFIIEQADLLNTHATNSLLKSLEEPPAGYHFIFLSQRLEILLPTLRSRCIIEHLDSSIPNRIHEQLIPFFTSQKTVSPQDFISVLEQSKITESETNYVLDTILTYWNNHYKNTLEEHNTSAQVSTMRVMCLIQNAMHHLPMPGSSKLFWKNFFLRYVHTKNNA